MGYNLRRLKRKYGTLELASRALHRSSTREGGTKRKSRKLFTRQGFGGWQFITRPRGWVIIPPRGGASRPKSHDVKNDIVVAPTEVNGGIESLCRRAIAPLYSGKLNIDGVGPIKLSIPDSSVVRWEQGLFVSRRPHNSKIWQVAIAIVKMIGL